jgi:hypothetical protein
MNVRSIVNTMQRQLLFKLRGRMGISIPYVGWRDRRGEAVRHPARELTVLPSATKVRRLAAANRAELQRAGRGSTGEVARRQFDALNDFAETLQPGDRQRFLDMYTDAVRALDTTHRTKLQNVGMPAANSHAISHVVLGVISALAVYLVFRFALS